MLEFHNELHYSFKLHKFRNESLKHLVLAFYNELYYSSKIYKFRNKSLKQRVLELLKELYYSFKQDFENHCHVFR